MPEVKSFYVYMVTNVRRGVIYTGVTGDLPNRIAQHRAGEIEGFTKRYGLKRLVWYEWHADANLAFAREKRLKRWRREWKFPLIEAMNPDWDDLWSELVTLREYDPGSNEPEAGGDDGQPE